MTINDFTSDLAIVRSNGGIVSEKYEQIEERYRTYSDRNRTNATQRFIDAVVEGAPDDEVALAHALAVADATSTPVSRAEVANALAAQVEKHLRRAYGSVAGSNYDRIADRFNEAGSKFAALHAIVPATTDPATLVAKTEKIRKAWLDAQPLANELERLVPALAAAARLAFQTPRITGTSAYIGLSVDTTGLHRRRVWEAWESPNRWTKLLTLGATIQAVDLDDYEPYREPAEMTVKQVRGTLPGGAITSTRQIPHDPEDDAYEAERATA